MATEVEGKMRVKDGNGNEYILYPEAKSGPAAKDYARLTITAKWPNNTAMANGKVLGISPAIGGDICLNSSGTVTATVVPGKYKIKMDMEQDWDDVYAPEKEIIILPGSTNTIDLSIAKVNVIQVTTSRNVIFSPYTSSIKACLIGGGGGGSGGAAASTYNTSNPSYGIGGGGGSGGTSGGKTITGTVTVTSNRKYPILIGAGGGGGRGGTEGTNSGKGSPMPGEGGGTTKAFGYSAKGGSVGSPPYYSSSNGYLTGGSISSNYTVPTGGNTGYAGSNGAYGARNGSTYLPAPGGAGGNGGAGISDSTYTLGIRYGSGGGGGGGGSYNTTDPASCHGAAGGTSTGGYAGGKGGGYCRNSIYGVMPMDEATDGEGRYGGSGATTLRSINATSTNTIVSGGGGGGGQGKDGYVGIKCTYNC